MGVSKQMMDGFQRGERSVNAKERKLGRLPAGSLTLDFGTEQPADQLTGSFVHTLVPPGRPLEVPSLHSVSLRLRNFKVFPGFTKDFSFHVPPVGPTVPWGTCYAG